MTVKFLAFLKAKAGIPRERFIEYYETRHVPLILDVMPGVVDYRRNYLPEGTAGFDVVSEIWFADRDALSRATALATAPAAARRIAEDEENFLDRTASVFSFPDERGGPVAQASS